nr:hypothetical protein K-LCC10_0180 [Kaumoebavirus]
MSWAFEIPGDCVSNITASDSCPIFDAALVFNGITLRGPVVVHEGRKHFAFFTHPDRVISDPVPIPFNMMYNSEPGIILESEVKPKIYTQVRNDFDLPKMLEKDGVFSMYVWTEGGRGNYGDYYNSVLRMKGGYAWIED